MILAVCAHSLSVIPGLLFCLHNHSDINNDLCTCTGARASTTFPAGSGPIYLDNVACSGREARLAECTYDSHTEDCHHFEDAGVHCERE